MDKKRPEEAAAHAEKALELMPLYYGANFALGRAYFELRQYPDAAENNRIFLTAAPNSVPGWSQFAMTYIFMGETEKAIEARLKLVDFAKDDQEKAIAYFSVADGHVMNREPGKALSFLAQGDALDPSNSQAEQLRGRAQFLLRKFALAETSLSKDLAIQPDNGYTLLWLYLAKIAQGQKPGNELDEQLARFE